MINREILYERNVSRSYMKIPACLEASFDELLMLKKSISGVLPVEKCYMNGAGQYWYNITGKQALDSYCKLKNIGSEIVGKIVLSVCKVLEDMEWNLLDVNCLVLDPEFIFVSNTGQQLFFTLYPENRGDIYAEFSLLLEYLLTKIDHKDLEAVRLGYEIYEISLKESYSLWDIKEFVLKNYENQEEDIVQSERLVSEKQEQKEGKAEFVEFKTKSFAKPFLKERTTDKILKKEDNKKEEKGLLFEQWLREPYQKMNSLYGQLQDKWKSVLSLLDGKEPVVVYPEEEPLPKKKESSTEIRIHKPEINPTICLTSASIGPRGKLLYEGIENMPDFQLNEEICNVGNNKGAEIYIQKDTVSYYHAQFEHTEEGYFLMDHNSTNGTFVNEEAVHYKERRKLNTNDVIRFADVKYRFL